MLSQAIREELEDKLKLEEWQNNIEEAKQREQNEREDEEDGD